MGTKNNEPTPCTRNQALAAGVLCDISEFGESVGMSCPVAISSAAWDECMAGVDGHLVVMRMQDVLRGLSYQLMLSALAGQGRSAAYVLEIAEADEFYRDSEAEEQPRPAVLTAMVEADDDGNRCLTIAVLGEDWRRAEAVRPTR